MKPLTGDDFRKWSDKLRAVEEKTEQEVAEQWESLKDLASGQDIAVLQTPTGYVLAPISDGKVLDDKEFEKLPKQNQKILCVKHINHSLNYVLEAV